MFDSLLIANRGEIACRIVATCRRLGIRTVAVYSDADRDARHVRMADEAVRLGPPPAAESYLVVERVLDAARRTGAAAVHPGYGFLSESSAFALAVREAGLIFVGPPPEAMERLGGKDSAKALLAPAGVPLVPGYHGADQADARLRDEANGIGFPLLIKATAGGGGKGMRRVDHASEFLEALASCRREAKAAFGDDRVLVERLIDRPRHVELQVFADRHGSAVHLFERDCTLQRRHQKIIEEAPAPGLDPDLRAALGQAATGAALAAGYENAGTVEFLLDQSGGFYFIEMNTRLQVEHPVTEAITGLDLVEWQLRIAAGEPLPLRQEEITCRGHAFEARLYAEDPARGFLPSIGRLRTLRLPTGLDGARVDTGVEEGDAVTPYYDPMIAKIIAHGADRAAALERLAAALDATQVDGVTTNLAFLRAAAASPEFKAMRLDTGWLDREGTQSLAADQAAEPATLLLAALATVALSLARPAPPPVPGTDWTSPWHRRDAWRLNQPPRGLVRLLDGKELHIVTVDGTAERFTARLGTDELHARCGVAGGRVWVESEGVRRSFPAMIVGHTLTLTLDGRRRTLVLEDGRFAARGEEEDSGLFTAPMPGKVTKLLVAPGDRVDQGPAAGRARGHEDGEPLRGAARRAGDGSACARGRPGGGGGGAARPAGGREPGVSPADLFASVPPEVTIVEVGPRDGLQNEATPVPVAAKVALIEALAEAGLPVVEAGSFVSPKWVPQMAGSDEVMRSVHRRSGVRYPVLVPNLKGLEAALAAGAEEIAVFGAASETFSQKNINCSIAESLERFRPVVQEALARNVRVRGYVSCVVGLPLRGRDRPGGGRPRGARAARHGLLRGLARRHRRGRHATQDRRHAGRGHARGSRGGARHPRPRHLRPGPCERADRAGARRARYRQLGRRPRRLPLRQGCVGQHRHRGRDLHARRNGRADGGGLGCGDRGRSRNMRDPGYLEPQQGGARPRPAEPAFCRHMTNSQHMSACVSTTTLTGPRPSAPPREAARKRRPSAGPWRSRAHGVLGPRRERA